MLRGDCQWVFKGSLLKLIWCNTVPNRDVSVTVSKSRTHGRSGKCCWSREKTEHFIESWETLSAGVVRGGVKFSGMQWKS